jgi:phytoene desaturase
MRVATVVGSGIGGLAAAIRLALKGYSVIVFEKAAYAGGKIAQIEDEGYRFDMGPSLFTLPSLVYELFALAGRNPKGYFEVIDLPVTCNYFFPDGKNIKAWSDHNKFVNEVVESGIARDVIENYLEKQSFLYNHTSDFFLFNSIHKVSTYFGEAGQKSLKALHRLDAFTSMHERNEKTFGKHHLTQLFDRYATYNGSDPYRAPATLNMIAHLEHNTGAFFPINGMYGIVDALIKLAVELGVEFHYNEAVKTITTFGNKVTAVYTEKQSYPCNLVVNDTDVTYFYRHLLPNKNMFDKLSKRERSSSALIFYWGVDFQSDLDVHNILFSSDYKAEFDGLFRTKTFANDLTVYIFISKKVVDTDAPAGKENWFVMVNAPENVGQNWNELTKQARKLIVEKIEKMLGVNIASKIETEKVITPVEIEARTASVNGSLYGHSSNSAIAAFLRHPNFSRKYKNLYFVGGSVHPGGGIPLCLASAKIVDGMVE